MNDETMKRFIIALFMYIAMIAIMSVVTSCTPPQRNQNRTCTTCDGNSCTQHEYINVPTFNGRTATYNVRHFKYNEHDYLLFGEGQGKCIVHDPDCEKCKYNSNSEY